MTMDVLSCTKLDLFAFATVRIKGLYCKDSTNFRVFELLMWNLISFVYHRLKLETYIAIGNVAFSRKLFIGHTCIKIATLLLIFFQIIT